MLKLGLGIDKTTKKISAFDADAQAFFNRVTAAGGSLTATEQTAVNTLVLELKGYSIWTSMQAIYPMVGASAAACAQNLKSSSFTGSFTSGWTFASTGVTPNGTSAFYDTTFVESVNSTINNQHISNYSRTNTTGGLVDIGTSNGTGIGTHIFSNISGTMYPRVNDNNGGTANNGTSLGFFMANRASSSIVKAIQNSTITNITSSSISLLTTPYYIGANRGVLSANQYSTRQTAFSSIGISLSNTEALNFYTAVQTFQTTLSRQV